MQYARKCSYKWRRKQRKEIESKIKHPAWKKTKEKVKTDWAEKEKEKNSP